MQYFYINKDSVLPRLQVEVITDGRYTYNHLMEMLQNAEITFTMVDDNTNVTKIAKAPCYIEQKDGTTCQDEFMICYDWKPRNVNQEGVFKGVFNIEFGEVKNDQTNEKMPTGNLIVPIRDDLMIIIR